MSGATCTLNGLPALRATIRLPRFGVWTADVELANIGDLAKGASAQLELLDRTYTGTITDGGPYNTRGWYRVSGGAAGWSKAMKPKSYRSQAGVKASTIINDAAREVGESVAAFTDSRVGPAYVRPAKGEAARVLDFVAPDGWYVDEDGVTHLGLRAAAAFAGTYRRLDIRPDLKLVTIAPDTLIGLAPGAQLENIEAASVRIELTDEGLRAHLWGTYGASISDRAWAAVARIVRAITRPHWFHGRYEYRVTGGSGGYLDLRPTQPSLGLPPLANVPVRVGAMGARGTPADSSTVLVGFINADPTRPFVDSFEGETGSASVPPESDIFAQVIKLGDSAAVALARADKVANELAALQSAHNTHTHIIAGTVPITGPAGTTAIAATAAATTTTYTPGSVACSKVKGT